MFGNRFSWIVSSFQIVLGFPHMWQEQGTGVVTNFFFPFSVRFLQISYFIRLFLTLSEWWSRSSLLRIVPPNWFPEKDSSLLLCQVKTVFYHWTIGKKEFLCQGQDSDELQTQNWWTFPVVPIHPPLHLEDLPIGQADLLGQIFWLVSACEC